MAVHNKVRLGGSLLDLTTGEVARGELLFRLGKRTLKLLRVLLDADGQLVSTEEVLRTVWPGLVVEANTVQVHVSLLRKALGPDRGCLRTLSGRGYRLMKAIDTASNSSLEEANTESAWEARTNLSRLVEPTVGRAEDLAAIQSLMSGHRLVSIVGTGGVGKTRLAGEVGWRVLDQYRDGVWLIDFASLLKPDMAATTVAGFFGITVSGDVDILKVLSASFATSQRLLIFDNCEYQVHALGRLAEALLHATSGISILVTSQEPLNLRSEVRYPLSPLQVPGENETDIDTYSAVEFFMDRALAWNPTFILTETTRPLVSEICRRLDGVPLALEMAAGRLSLLGIQGLAQVLDDRLDLFRSSSATASHRHSNLETLLQWSVGLLSIEESQFLFRLGIFRTSFSVKAAASVACDPDVSQWTALDLLGQLVNKSLVVLVKDDPPRYRLLETVRLFALRKLADTSQLGIAHERLTTWLIRRFKQASQEWDFLSDKDWLARYVEDIEDVLASVTWGFGQPETAGLAADLIAYSSRLFRTAKFHVNESSAHREQALLTAKQGLDPETHALLLIEQVQQILFDAPSRALVFAQQAISIYRAEKNDKMLSRALAFQGVLESRLGMLQSADESLGEAERLMVAEGPSKSLSTLFLYQGYNALNAERFDDARRFYTSALAGVRRISDEYREGIILSNLGVVFAASGDSKAAVSITRDALRKYSPFAHATDRCTALANVAGYLLDDGQASEVALLLEEAIFVNANSSVVSFRTRLQILVRCAALGAQGNRLDPAAMLIGFLQPQFDSEDTSSHGADELFCFRSTFKTLESCLDTGQFQHNLARGALLAEHDAFLLALDDIVTPVLSADVERNAA